MAINYGDSVFDIHYSDVQRAIIKAWSEHDGEKSSEDYTRLAYRVYCHKGIAQVLQVFEFTSVKYNYGCEPYEEFESISLNTYPTNLDNLSNECLATMPMPHPLEKGVHHMLQDWGVVVAQNKEEAISLWVNNGAVVTARYDDCVMLHNELS